MSFWATLQNEQATGTAEIGGGEPIPNNTQLLAMVDEAKHDSYEGDQFISLRWCVLDGPYKGRKVFHKLKVYEADQAKAQKAIRMLSAVDVNAGGKLRTLGRQPTDQELLMAIGMKPMLIKVGVWKLDDGRTGNWVQSVAPSTAAAPVAAAPAGGSNPDVPYW